MAIKEQAMSEIDTMLSRILAFRRERNWEQFHKPKDVAISLMLESAEVAEHFQWKNDQEIARHIELHRDSIGEELSDVLYWVLLMSHDLGIDLAAAFEKKMNKNETKYPVEKCRDRHTKYSEL